MSTSMQQIISWLKAAIGLALLAVMAVTAARMLGVQIPMGPRLSPTDLAYLCGAWWLLAKAS